MSIRIMPAILAAALSAAFGFPPANAQEKPQPPQSLRLYVLDCGIRRGFEIVVAPGIDRKGLDMMNAFSAMNLLDPTQRR